MANQDEPPRLEATKKHKGFMPLNIAKRIQLAGRALLRGDGPLQKRRSTEEIPTITLDEVAEAKSFFPLDKFFIFGHARSGTTLLARLIRLHPQVHCNYQAHFFTRAPLLEGLVSESEIGAWLARRSNRWNRGRDLSPLVLRAASDFILERDARREGKGSPGCMVGDKSPNSLLDGEAVRRMVKVYPDGRLINIIRDGRDTALSHRFQAFIDNPQSLSRQDLEIRDDFARRSEPFLRGELSIFTEKNLRQAAEGWVKNVVETDRVARELLGDQYCSVRYEDLLDRPVEEMRRLWSFLGVNTPVANLDEAVLAELGENPDAEWQQHKASEIASPLHKGKQGSWREMFTTRDQELFHAIAGDTLRSWGYEV
jgi:hypothetical protein